jgi:two-component system response regulator AtoC
MTACSDRAAMAIGGRPGRTPPRPQPVASLPRWNAAALVFAVAIVLAPVWMGGGHFLARDDGRMHAPVKRFLASELAAGRWPGGRSPACWRCQAGGSGAGSWRHPASSGGAVWDPRRVDYTPGVLQNVLVVDDEASMRHLLTLILADRGYQVRAVASAQAALEELTAREFDVVLTDVRMPGGDGIALTRAIQDRQPGATVIVMSAYGSHDAAIEAMKAGAYDFLPKPFKPDEVVLCLRKAEERERLAQENRRLRAELRGAVGVDAIVGGSEAVQAVLRQVRKVAPQKTTVLLTGESGTGKELVARALHDLSPRAAAPFVAVNCGAIPGELLESELFGHVKGAFTDAVRAKKGLAAEADGGTLFLDEIGELPLALQVKLLRFLQEEEVRPVGDTRSQKVDVRVVAATARDLSQAVATGQFREDLFWRLNVVAVELPPLRERPGDVAALARHFLQRFAPLRPELPGLRFTPEALEALQGHRWPGNVRELMHAVERAVVLAEGAEIREEDLPEPVRLTVPGGGLPTAPGDLSVKRGARALEERLIREALARTGGNRTRAADLLELSYRALLYKIKEYGLG